MELLGNSQTFIGVLTSLVVIFIVVNHENFGNPLNVFFRNIISQNEDKINSLKGNIETKRQDIRNHWINEIATYRNRIRRRFPDPENVNRQKLFNNIRWADVKVTRLLNSHNAKYSSEFLAPIDVKKLQIEESKGRSFSPLVVSLFCLILFLCDELVWVFPESRDHITLFLFFFTTFLSIFLLAMWAKFLYESSLIFEPPEAGYSGHTFKSYCKKAKFEAGLLCVIFFWMVWGLCLKAHLLDFASFWWILLPLCCLLLGGTGSWHINKYRTYGKFTYSFILFHFAAILGISILFTIIFCSTYEALQAYMPVKEIHFPGIKLFIVLFIIVFGIVAPLLCPCIASEMLVRKASKKYVLTISEMEKEEDFIMQNIQQFSQEIRHELARFL